MKLKETEFSFQQYHFHFQLVQWGKYTVFAENTASEMSMPVIQRYLRTGKGELVAVKIFVVIIITVKGQSLMMQ